MDIKTQAERSANMGAIKNKNTRPELFIRSLLHRAGYRFSLHRRDLPGSPDIVLPKFKTVIFVNGCFWHSHQNCRKSQLPSSNMEFWKSKIQSNVERDKSNYKQLRENAWKVLVIWTCACSKKKEDVLIGRIASFLRSDKSFEEIGE